jgi:hypothetical protein
MQDHAAEIEIFGMTVDSVLAEIVQLGKGPILYAVEQIDNAQLNPEQSEHSLYKAKLALANARVLLADMSQALELLNLDNRALKVLSGI